MEKNPKTTAVRPENNSASIFLYFNWRTTDTTANNATSKNKIPNTIWPIRKTPPFQGKESCVKCQYLLLCNYR